MSMPVDLAGPDLVVSVDLGPDAPRAARHYVGQVDRPSPDLRDAVSLLTSELVTRAVQQSPSTSAEAVELRVWMPADVVRVELRGAPELVHVASEQHGPRYDVLLLGQIADRWSVETAETPACMWFEIDRHRPEREPEPVRERRHAIPRPSSLPRLRRRATMGGRGASG
jgi:hypothetical protein